MAEEIAGLTVKLALENADFNRRIQDMNRDIRLASSEFKNAGAGTEDFGKSLDGAKARAEMLTKQIEAQSKVVEMHKQAYDKSKETLEKNAKAQEDLGKKVEESKRAYEESKATLGENAEETKKLKTEYNNLSDEYTTNEEKLRNNVRTMENAENKFLTTETRLKGMESQLKKTNAEIDKQSSSWTKFGKSLDPIGKNLTKIGSGLESAGKSLTTKLTMPIIGAGAAATKLGMDFDESMANVRALAQPTAEEFKQLGNVARDMGAKTSKSAKESADALGYMALAGWDTTQMMQGIEPILRLSEAGSMDLARASDLVTDSMSAMGIEVKDLESYLDKVAKTQASANTSADGMLEAYVGAGGMFKQLNTDLDTSAALLGILANRGIKASEAGTSLNSILVNMSGSTKKSAETFKALGISLYDVKGNYRGVDVVLMDFKKKLASLTEEQQNFYMAEIAGKTQIDTLAALLDGLGNEYGDLKGQIQGSNGALLDMADVMMDTNKGSLVELGSAVEELGLKIYDVLRPAIGEGIDKLQEWTGALNDMDSSQTEAAVNIAKSLAKVGPAMLIGGKVVGGLGNIVSATSEVSLAMGEMSGSSEKGMQKIGTAMMNTGGKTKILGAVLKGVFSPTGAVIGGTVAGLLILKKHLEDNDKAMEKSQKERSKFVKGYSDTVKENKNSIKTMEALRKEFESLNPLVADNGDLSRMSKEQKERYLEIVEKLVESGSGIETFYNEEGRLIADTTSNMNDLIDAKKEEMALDAQRMKIETKKALEEEAKAIAKVVDQQQHLIEEKERVEKLLSDGGFTDIRTGVFTPFTEKQIANNEKALEKVNKALDKNKEKLEETKLKMIELRNAGLQGIGAELDNINPNVNNLKKSFDELMETDTTGEKTSKAIEGLDKVFKELDTNINITKRDAKLYANELSGLGLETSYVTDEIVKMATKNKIGAENFELVNRALNEYNSTGKISAETSKEFAQEFGQIPEKIEDFSVDTLQKLEKNGEGWLSTYMATSLDLTKGAVADYNAQVQELDLKLESDLITPGQYEESLAKLEKHRQEFVDKLNKEKEESLELIRYLFEDAKIINKEEADLRAKEIDDYYKSQMEHVQKGFEGVKSELKDKAGKLAPELDKVLIDLVSGTKSLDEAWNGLSFESKEFVAKQVGIDDVSKMTEELLKKWLQKPGVLEFIVQHLGIDATIDSVDGLMKYWDNLDTDQRGRIVNELMEKGIVETKEKPVEAAKQTSKEVVDELDKTGEKAEKSGKDAGEKYAKGVEGQKSKGQKAGKDLGEATTQTLDEAKAEAQGAGVNIVEGFSLGLKPTQSLLQSARNVAGAALSQMRSVLDTHSPSKETEKYGKWTGEGLEIGLEKSIPDVTKTAGDLAKETLKAMETELKDAELTVPEPVLKSQASSALSGKNKNFANFTSKLKADELEETKKLLEKEHKMRDRAYRDRINNLKGFQVSVAKTKDKKANARNQKNAKAAKDRNKKQIEAVQKERQALNDRNNDLKEILDDRLDIINEKMTKEANIFTDRMTQFDESIKRLSKTTDDLTQELTNNNAILILQRQRVEELQKQHQKVSKEFGGTSTEAIKLRKSLEEAKTAYENYGDAIVATEEKIRESKITLVNDTVNRVKAALTKQYQEAQRAEEQAISDSIENLSRWEKESKDRINSVYDEKIKRVKESSEQAIKSIQDEIDAIDKLQKQEDKEDVDKKELKEISGLEEALLYEHDEFNKLEIKKKIDQLKQARDKRLRKQEQDDRKQALQNEIKDIQEATNEEVAIYEERRKEEIERIDMMAQYEKENLDNRMEEIKNHYARRLDQANIQAEAEKMVMDNNQKEIIKLLRSYENDYEAVGQSLGDKFVDGFSEKIKGIQSTIDSLNWQIDQTRNEAVQAMVGQSEGSGTGAAASSKVSNTVNIYSNERLDHYGTQRETENTLRRLALT